MPNGSLISQFRAIPSAFGRSPSRNYLPELDGLRGIAILLVLVWHASLRATRAYQAFAPPDAQGFYNFFPHGEIGVLLFFVISGFVVSQPFLARPIEQWRVGAFYKSRFIRIFPPYFLAIGSCYLILGVFGHVPVNANSFNQDSIPLAQSFAASIFYFHSYIFDAPSRLNPPIWSLEIEVLFYVLVPIILFAYMAIDRRWRALSLVVIIVLNLLLTSMISSSIGSDVRFRWGFIFHAYLFFLGILIADLFKPDSTGRKSSHFDGAAAGGLVLLIFVGLVFTRTDARLPGGLLSFAVQGAIVVALVAVIIGTFKGRWASALLSRPWMRLIGTMCYSIYLTHIIVMQALSEILSRFVTLRDPVLIWGVWFAVLIPLCLVTGFVFYLAVERPFARLSSSMSQSRPRRVLHPS